MNYKTKLSIFHLIFSLFPLNLNLKCRFFGKRIRKRRARLEEKNGSRSEKVAYKGFAIDLNSKSHLGRLGSGRWWIL
ncbi:hypothetical protein A3SI_09283 [Nitritalea halalkaliphila LW7]|uniref:Uncharacterized protein n=1 Tax=Nitritalea halalkaliphila LW7 TaxID=1189621 RepID=I5C494_9BACT|nr:hypothetical protein A3SI_09283 [Nitritalea halalkaliphila LW7]